MVLLFLILCLLQVLYGDPVIVPPVPQVRL